MIQRLKLAAVLALSVVMFTPVIAAAQQTRVFPVRVVTVANSPVAITNCKSGSGMYGFDEFANIVNRTSHGMLSVTIQWRFYDGENSAIGSATRAISPSEPLGAGDSSVLDVWLGGTTLSEPIIVPAHGTVTVTVSFAVEDAVADPNANREVAQQ